MSKEYISVCKNVIASNNKKKWVDADPSIRISKSKSGKAISRVFSTAILDSQGNEVARIVSSKDGNPVLKCGAKVAIITEYPTKEI